MRISMVSEHASPLASLGGVAGAQNLHVAELSAALCRRGHEVTVYTRRDDTDISPRVTAPAGYEVVHVTAGPPRQMPTDNLLPYMSDFSRELAARWATREPDVVHAHFWMSGLASLLAQDAVPVPVVQTFHSLGSVKKRYEGDADTSPRNRVRLEREIGAQASMVAATCSDEVFELKRMDVPRSRISVVPYGVDLSEFSPAGPTAPKHHKHRLVTVGRLTPGKGFDIAIAALAGLPDTELVIVGGSGFGGPDQHPEARRLYEYAERLGVAERVYILGEVSRTDMPILLRSADAAVCVPWYEPFGVVPLEAMACGVPVIAAAVGGLTDTVVDGVTGELVPPRSPDALANAVHLVLANRATRDAYGFAGHQRARSRYSWDRIAGQTLRLYDRVATDTSAIAGRAAL